MDRTRTLTVGIVAVATLLIAGCETSGSWSAVPTPNPATTNSLSALVALSPTEIWAIGNASSSSYTGCKGRTLTARWNGSAFVEVPGADSPICASVTGAAGLSTSNIWAVGSTNSGRDTHIRHWNGTKWSIDPGATIPLPPSGGRRLRTTGFDGIAGVGPNDVWAVGRAEFADFTRAALAEHWNGSAWTLVPVNAGDTSRLFAVSARVVNDVWAVGSKGGGTLAVHWNGTGWSTVVSPNANLINELHGVAAGSANDVWAVGTSIKNPGDGVSVNKTLIEHWNGTSWSIVPSPNVGTSHNVLNAVSARSATDIWAVGYYDDASGDIPIRRTLTLHWNGSSWTRFASANPGTGDNWLTGVVTPASSTTSWSVGSSAAGTLVERYS